MLFLNKKKKTPKQQNKTKFEDKVKPIGLLSNFEDQEALQYYLHYKTHTYPQ